MNRPSHCATRWISGIAFVFLCLTAHAKPFDHFDSDAQELSWVNAYLLGLVSYFAYRSKLDAAAGDNTDGEDYFEKAQATYEPLGLDVVEWIDERSAAADTQAVVLRNDDMFVVAFSGSENEDKVTVLKDWVLTDARLLMREVNGARVHSGFLDALDVAYEKVRASIEEHADDRDVWITGHSLGGALAALAAFRLDLDGLPVRGVYTYAGPRVGDMALTEQLEKKLGNRFQRWIVDRDPVPRVPPRTEKFPYEAAGMSNVLFSDGDYELDVDKDPGSLPNPASHIMTVYANFLFRALPEENRKHMPDPPSLCGTGQKHVGNHPDDGKPMCKLLVARKISQSKCEDKGDAVIDEWCASENEEKFRYSVRPLKP